MVFALPLPADCILYSGRNNNEHQTATTKQALCIYQLKWMLYNDSIISIQAVGGYLDGLTILTTYAQCTLLDLLLQYQFDKLVLKPINELASEGCLYKADLVC